MENVNIKQRDQDSRDARENTQKTKKEQRAGKSRSDSPSKKLRPPQDPKNNSGSPDGFFQGAWKDKEDAILVETVLVTGSQDWEKIAAQHSQLSGKLRSADSCQLRWNTVLNPAVLHTSDFNHEEDCIIVALHESVGNQWKLINRCLPLHKSPSIKFRFLQLSKHVMLGNFTPTIAVDVDALLTAHTSPGTTPEAQAPQPPPPKPPLLSEVFLQERLDSYDTDGMLIGPSNFEFIGSRDRVNGNLQQLVFSPEEDHQASPPQAPELMSRAHYISVLQHNSTYATLQELGLPLVVSPARSAQQRYALPKDASFAQGNPRPQKHYDHQRLNDNLNMSFRPQLAPRLPPNAQHYPAAATTTKTGDPLFVQQQTKPAHLRLQDTHFSAELNHMSVLASLSAGWPLNFNAIKPSFNYAAVLGQPAAHRQQHLQQPYIYHQIQDERTNNYSLANQPFTQVAPQQQQRAAPTQQQHRAAAQAPAATTLAYQVQPAVFMPLPEQQVRPKRSTRPPRATRNDDPDFEFTLSDKHVEVDAAPMMAAIYKTTSVAAAAEEQANAELEDKEYEELAAMKDEEAVAVAAHQPQPVVPIAAAPPPVAPAATAAATTTKKFQSTRSRTKMMGFKQPISMDAADKVPPPPPVKEAPTKPAAKRHQPPTLRRRKAAEPTIAIAVKQRRQKLEKERRKRENCEAQCDSDEVVCYKRKRQ